MSVFQWEVGGVGGDSSALTATDVGISMGNRAIWRMENVDNENVMAGLIAGMWEGWD